MIFNEIYYVESCTKTRFPKGNGFCFKFQHCQKQLKMVQ